jgi:hypothetical protein
MTLPEALDACRARLRKPAYWIFVLALPIFFVPSLFFFVRQITVRAVLQALAFQAIWSLGVFTAALPWQWIAAPRKWLAALRGFVQACLLTLLLAALASLALVALSAKGGSLLARGLDLGGGLVVLFGMLFLPIGLVGARVERMDSLARAARLKAREAQWMSHRGAFSPHLLFRNLHRLADRAPGEARDAEKGLLELAALYRQWLIEAEKPLIPFAAERDITEHYLALEQKLWGERLRIRWILDPTLDAWPVPPLLFLTLLDPVLAEGPEKGPLELEFRAIQKGDDLALRLALRGAAPPPGEALEAQLRQRIRTVLDGGDVSQSATEGGWEAWLRVPSWKAGEPA